jgi:hypothetical protein
MHYVGVEGGAEYGIKVAGFTPVVAVSTGMKLIGSYRSLYGGFSSGISYNFARLAWDTMNAYNGQVIFVAPEVNLSFSMGFERFPGGVVMRHEFSLGATYQYTDSEIRSSTDSMQNHLVEVTFGYTLSFGKDGRGGKKSPREPLSHF